MDWYPDRVGTMGSVGNCRIPTRSGEVSFGLATLDRARAHGKPDSFNRDQRVPFTLGDYTARLEVAGVSIARDGRGRVFDNIFIERRWRSVKYEDVYRKDYDRVPAVMAGLGAYFAFHNTERRHQALGYRTPERVYYGSA